jgi:hypothetical protein
MPSHASQSSLSLAERYERLKVIVACTMADVFLSNTAICIGVIACPSASRVLHALGILEAAQLLRLVRV